MYKGNPLLQLDRYEGFSMRVLVEFVSEGFKICGKLYPAMGEPRLPTVLLLQGFPGNEDDLLGLGERMSRHGINSLTFNYRGTHRSEGTFSLRSTLKDIQAALEYLRQEEVVRRFKIDTGKLVLGGYSYGGGMAFAYAANHPEIKRIFSIAGTDHGEFGREYMRNAEMREMIDAMFEKLKFPTGPVRYSSEMPLEELIKNPAPYDLRLHAAALADRDLLLIGGWDDSNVTIEHHIVPLYRALVNLKAEVRIAAFQDNHVFSKCRDELTITLVDWMRARNKSNKNGLGEF